MTTNLSSVISDVSNALSTVAEDRLFAIADSMEVEESIRKNTSTPAQLKFPDESILPREGDRNDGRDTSSGRQREDTQFLLRQSLFSSHFLKAFAVPQKIKIL